MKRSRSPELDSKVSIWIASYHASKILLPKDICHETYHPELEHQADMNDQRMRVICYKARESFSRSIQLRTPEGTYLTLLGIITGETVDSLRTKARSSTNMPNCVAHGTRTITTYQSGKSTHRPLGQIRTDLREAGR